MVTKRIVTMKTKYLYIASIAILMLSGCKDDEIINRPEVNGNEVQFGTSLDPTTRTEYGTETNGAYPIYWNQTGNLDNIFIFSPDSPDGHGEGYYTVHPNEGNRSTGKAVKNADSAGVQWGNGETSNFYAFYPGVSNFNLQANEAQLTATLPGNQIVTFSQEETEDQTAVGGGTFTYVGTPDMNNCMMVASSTGDKGSENVSLKFSPLSSVLDITIDGTEDTNFVLPDDAPLNRKWARVTSIEVSSNKQICGTFTYNFENGTVEANSTDEADKVIRIDTRRTNADGNLEGIRLYDAQKMNIKVFLIPNELKNSDITVKVYTADNAVWEKALVTTRWEDRQINPATLPKLKLSNQKFDYSVWMSQLDPRIKISELSIPGSVMSFAAGVSENQLSANKRPQTEDYMTQYNNGIRVFQTHVWLADAPGSADGGASRIVIRNGNNTVPDHYLFDIIENLCTAMRNDHSQEYCVVVISDYKIDDDDNNKYTLSDLYKRLTALTNHERLKDYMVTDINPNTTLADVAGKVILKIQLNGAGTRSVSSLPQAFTRVDEWKSLNSDGQTVKALLSQWIPDAGNGVVYARAAFGEVGTASLTGFSNTSTLQTSSDTNPKTNVDTYVSGTGILGAAYRNLITNANWTRTRASIFSSYYYVPADDTPIISSLTGEIPSTVLDNDFWYIFTEQAEISDLDLINSNIEALCKAIGDTYVGKNNKRYMNYVGGYYKNGGDIVSLSKQLYATWWNATNGNASLKKKPWGWVLFNRVCSAAQEYNTSTEAGVTINPIQRVINHNNEFKLTRGTPSVSSTSPQGDAKFTPAGLMF